MHYPIWVGLHIILFISVYNLGIILLMNYSDRDLESGIVVEYINTQWMHQTWIDILSARLYGRSWKFWTVKIKKVVGIYSDLSYHLLLYFEWRINHDVEDSTFMCTVVLIKMPRFSVGKLLLHHYKSDLAHI